MLIVSREWINLFFRKFQIDYNALSINHNSRISYLFM